MSARTRVMLLAVAVAALALAAWALPLGQWLRELIQWIEAHRETAWSAFIGVYVAATVLMVPGSILTLAAGFVFGVVAGTILVSVSSITGATAAFLLGRYLGRDWVRRKVGADRRLAAIDRAAEDKGFLIVMLLRLSPLFPFNALNYFLSLTGVRLGHYFLASWIGMLPATILYVYVGSVAKDLTTVFAGDVEAGGAGRILFFVGLAATAVVTVLVTRVATKALRSELAAAGENGR